ncbi:MAG: RHS repeat-associated core domain-containing protein, partial [Oscillospiraceae bacterium]|nr:RHS repeat-associated core domain-containing protein [Oscillospiraceae bacterium]
MQFIYTEEGTPFGMMVNGEPYLYVTNQQGDVTMVTDRSGLPLCSYTYDAWGNVLSITGEDTEIGELNPIRYRGYYQDVETGLYYLQSRYYDPATMRFIN